MDTIRTPTAQFSLLGFVLEVNGEGRATQRISRCGSFVSIEEAFEFARVLTQSQWRILSEKASGDASAQSPEVVSTEWGYDIRQGMLVVQRFWVHDSQASSLKLA